MHLQNFQSEAVQAVQVSFASKQEEHLAALKADHIEKLNAEFAAARDRWNEAAGAAGPSGGTDKLLEKVDPESAVRIQSAFRGLKARNSAKDLNKAEIEKGGAAAIFLGGPSEYSNLDADETMRRAAHGQLKRKDSKIEDLEHELVRRDGIVAGLNNYLDTLGAKLKDVVTDVAYVDGDEMNAVATLRQELKQVVGGLNSAEDATNRLAQLEAGVSACVYISAELLLACS